MCCPAPLACGNYSGQAERGSGIGLKLFGLIPESVFTFIPEHCSGSSRNAVRNHPGIAFTFARIPQHRHFLSAIRHFRDQIRELRWTLEYSELTRKETILKSSVWQTAGKWAFHRQAEGFSRL